MATQAELDIIFQAKNQAAGVIRQLRGDLRGLEDQSRGISRVITSALGTGIKVAAGAAVAGVTALGTAAVATTTSGIRMAAELEAQLSNIAAVMGMTREEIEPLQQIIYDLGLDPNLKVTTFEAADVMEQLAKNGLTRLVKGGEDLDTTFRNAAWATVQLSNATGGDFADSAKVATDILWQFRMNAEDLGSVVDWVTGAVNNSKLTFDDYRYMIGNVGGAAAALGLEFEDVNTAMAMTISSFTSGQTAGTAFRQFLLDLTGRSEKARDAMDDLGLEFFDEYGKMKDMPQIIEELNTALYGPHTEYVRQNSQLTGRQAEDLADLRDEYAEVVAQIDDYESGLTGVNMTEEERAKTLEDLTAKAAGLTQAMEPYLALQGELVATTRQLTQEEVNHALKTIFGHRAFIIAQKLAEEGVIAYDQLYSLLEESDAEEAAAERMRNLAGAVEILGGVWENIRIQIGDSYLDGLADSARSVTRILGATTQDLITVFSRPATFLDTKVVPTLSNLADIFEAGGFEYDGKELTMRVKWNILGDGQGFTKIAFGDLVDFTMAKGAVTSSLQFKFSDIIDFSTMELPTEGFTKLKIGEIIDWSSEWFSDTGGGIKKLSIGELVDFQHLDLPALGFTKLAIGDIIDFTMTTAPDGLVKIQLNDRSIDMDMSEIRVLINAKMREIFKPGSNDPYFQDETWAQQLANAVRGGITGISTNVQDYFGSEDWQLTKGKVMLGMMSIGGVIQGAMAEDGIVGVAIQGMSDMFGSITTALDNVDAEKVSGILNSVFGGVSEALGVFGGMTSAIEVEAVTGALGAVASLLNLTADVTAGLETAPFKDWATNVVSQLSKDLATVSSDPVLLDIGGAAGSLVANVITQIANVMGDFEFGENLGEQSGEIVASLAAGAMRIITGFANALGAADWSEVKDMDNAAAGFVAGFGKALSNEVLSIEFSNIATALLQAIARALNNLNPFAEYTGGGIIGDLAGQKMPTLEDHQANAEQSMKDLDSFMETVFGPNAPDPKNWTPRNLANRMLFGWDKAEEMQQGAEAMDPIEVTVQATQVLPPKGINATLQMPVRGDQPEFQGPSFSDITGLQNGGILGGVDALPGVIPIGPMPEFEWPEYPAFGWPDMPPVDYGDPPDVQMEAPSRPGWLDALLGWSGGTLNVNYSYGSQSPGPTGTPPNAAGSLNWGGGWTMVGEEGREIVNLPRGSRIYSNSETEGMLGGNTVVNINIDGGNAMTPADKRALAYEVADVVKQELRRRSR